jgi:hypothetical protein
MEKQGPDSYLSRMIRAARLDVTLYEEVKNDPGAIAQAMGIVILAGLSAGVVVATLLGKGQADVAWVLLGTLWALIEWFIWTLLLFYIGTRILPEPDTRASYGQLLRPIGFASVIGVARLLVLVPGMAIIVLPVVTVWMLIATVLAVRVALGYSSSMRALGVCAIGFFFEIALSLLLRSLFEGGGAPIPIPAG